MRTGVDKASLQPHCGLPVDSLLLLMHSCSQTNRGHSPVLSVALNKAVPHRPQETQEAPWGCSHLEQDPACGPGHGCCLSQKQQGGASVAQQAASWPVLIGVQAIRKCSSRECSLEGLEQPAPGRPGIVQEGWWLEMLGLLSLRSKAHWSLLGCAWVRADACCRQCDAGSIHSACTQTGCASHSHAVRERAHDASRADEQQVLHVLRMLQGIRGCQIASQRVPH